MENVNNFSNLLSTMFNLVDFKVYEILDSICDIDEKIFIKEPLKYFITNKGVNGIILIANSILLFSFVYYMLIQLISLYNGYKIKNIYLFVTKIIIVTIIVNNSYDIMKEIITFNNYITEAFEEYGSSITGESIKFSSLIKLMEKNELFEISQDNNSLNSIIKGIISYGSIRVLFEFAVRYVSIIFLILIFPIVIAFGMTDITEGILKSYIKVLVTNLVMQNIVKLIISISLACRSFNSDIFKVIFIGSIYLIYNLKIVVTEIFNLVIDGRNKESLYE